MSDGQLIHAAVCTRHGQWTQPHPTTSGLIAKFIVFLFSAGMR